MPNIKTFLCTGWSVQFTVRNILHLPDTAIAGYISLTERNRGILAKSVPRSRDKILITWRGWTYCSKYTQRKNYFCIFETEHKNWNDWKLGCIYRILASFMITVLKLDWSDDGLSANFFSSSVFLLFSSVFNNVV